MLISERCLFWAAVSVLVLALPPGNAVAQELDLSTYGGYEWKAKDMGGTSDDLAPAAKDYPDATEANGWQVVEVPFNLNPDYVGENTNFWYRLEGLTIPNDWPRDRYLVLSGFNVDDEETTYINGIEIGLTSGWDTVRTYYIPPSVFDFDGPNVIAMRGWNGTGGAGMSSTGPLLSVAPIDSGFVKIVVKRPDGRPVRNVLVTQPGAGTDGADLDLLTDAAGEIVVADLPVGTARFVVEDFPWVGSLSPTGNLDVEVKGGQVTELALTVNPFTYTVVKAATPITIDGDITGPEWDGAVAMKVDHPKQTAAGGADSTTNWSGPDDASVIAKWKWDNEFIYLAADVTDDSRVNEHIYDEPGTGNQWQGDGFETYIQLDPYDARRTNYALGKNFQWTIGVNGDNELNWKIFRSAPADTAGDNPGANKEPPDIPEPTDHVKVITKTTGKPGYILEARFPWASLPDVDRSLIPPKAGTEGAIALALNDTDEEGNTARESQLSWNTRSDMWQSGAAFTRAIWADVPSAGGVPGDANQNGRLDVTDVIAVLRHVAAITPLTGDALALADVDGRAGVSVTDAVWILRKVAGLE